MYQSFINCEEDFEFYNGIITNYQCKSVIEIGCGTGKLSEPFLKTGIEYTGLDLGEKMLNIARANHPSAVFIKRNMRNFILPQKYLLLLLPAVALVIYLPVKRF